MLFKSYNKEKTGINYETKKNTQTKISGDQL